jgi:hypothetical protein
LNIAVRQNCKLWQCIRKQYGPFPGGDLISARIDPNTLLSCTLPSVLCSYLLRVFSLYWGLIIEPSSGVSIGVTPNSMQLARAGNIPKHFVCVGILLSCIRSYGHLHLNLTVTHNLGWLLGVLLFTKQ